MKIISKDKERAYRVGDIVRLYDKDDEDSTVNYGMIVEYDTEKGDLKFLLAVLGSNPTSPSFNGRLTGDGFTVAEPDEGAQSPQDLVKQIREYGFVVNKVKLYGVEE